MTNKQILETAIQKAIDGGWRGELLGIVVRIDGAGTVRLENPFTNEEWSVEEIIFNHNFAKALWGEERIVNIKNYQALKRMGWQHHLQQMVIAEDPIAYLGSNL